MNKFSLLGIVIVLLSFTSCDLSGIKNDTKKTTITEVWIWDRLEFNQDGVHDVFTTHDEWRINFFQGGQRYFVVPYVFIFYDDGYYITCDTPGEWNHFLEDYEDGDGPGYYCQFWKIADSYFYTTYTNFKAKPEDEFFKNYKIISNSSNTIVLKPIEDAKTYGGQYNAWTVTLRKGKLRDFHPDDYNWW